MPPQRRIYKEVEQEEVVDPAIDSVPLPIATPEPFVKPGPASNTDGHDENLYRALETLTYVGSDEQKSEAQAQLDLIDSGQMTVAEVSREFGSGPSKLASVLGSFLVKPAVEAFTALDSLTASALNTAVEAVPPGPFDDMTKPAPDRPADSDGMSGRRESAGPGNHPPVNPWGRPRHRQRCR